MTLQDERGSQGCGGWIVILLFVPSFFPHNTSTYFGNGKTYRGLCNRKTEPSCDYVYGTWLSMVDTTHQTSTFQLSEPLWNSQSHTFYNSPLRVTAL
jgi:hypothetical protein